MSKEIQKPTREQQLQIEAGFIKAYGKSYTRMSKRELATMVANQSMNYKKMEEQAHKISTLGMMYYKRWKDLRGIVRKKEGKDD